MLRGSGVKMLNIWCTFNVLADFEMNVSLHVLNRYCSFMDLCYYFSQVQCVTDLI